MADQTAIAQPEDLLSTRCMLAIAEGGLLFTNPHRALDVVKPLREDVLQRGIDNLKCRIYELVSFGGSHDPDSNQPIVTSRMRLSVTSKDGTYTVKMKGSEDALDSESVFHTRSEEGCRDYILGNLAVFAKGFVQLTDAAVEKINGEILAAQEADNK